MLKKATHCIKSWGGGGGELFELDDQSKLYFWETFKYLCSFLSAVSNEKKKIFKQNKKN